MEISASALFSGVVSGGMTTPSEARALLERAGLKQVELAAEMSRLTGRSYSPQTVNAWFREGGRGPSDACVIFLRMRLGESLPGGILRR